VSVLAAMLSGLVVPGLRGNAPERVVVNVEGIAHAVSGIAWVALLFTVVAGSIELSRAPRVAGWARVAPVGAGGAVVALLLVAFRARLPTPLTLALAGAALCVALVAAAASMSAPHTRAVGVILGILATSAVARIFAWEIAYVAGERANPALYSAGRVLATAGVVIEGVGQLVATTWLGTRSRVAGQLLALLAVGASFFLTWGAAQGAYAGAPSWQSIVHTALADAPGVPAPYGLAAFATFLAPAALLLALVAAVQPRQPGVVVGALALALLGRGAYDVPLRALAVAGAGIWLVLATADGRAMWKSLTAEQPSG